jgi:hypothetical protein
MIIPQHTIGPIHCTGYTALLKILHSHFWWDIQPCCYDLHWLNNVLIFLGLHTYINLRRLIIFFTDAVIGIKNLNTCVAHGLRPRSLV